MTATKTKRPKYGGRKKGTPNKVTAEMRPLLRDLLTENYEKLQTEMATLEGREFVAAYTQLLKYVVPALQAVSMDVRQDADPLLMRLKALCTGDTGTAPAGEGQL